MKPPFTSVGATCIGVPPAAHNRFSTARLHPRRRPVFILTLLAIIASSLVAATAARAVPALRLPVTNAAWPHADAVNEIIDKHYVVSADGSWVLRSRVACRIQSYKGKKDHADLKITYNDAWQRVRIVTARTITATGGEIPVDRAEINDIPAPWTAAANIYAGTRQRVINFPAVEPGCTVTAEFTITSDRGFWATELFALPDPIGRKTVSIDLPVALPLAMVEPPGVQRREQRSTNRRLIIWSATERPAEIPEPLLPAPENRGACLLVSTFGSWRDTAEWFKDLLPAPPASSETVSSADTGQGHTVAGSGAPEAALLAAEKGAAPKGGNPPATAADVDRIYLELMATVSPRPIDLLDSNLEVQTPAKTRTNGYGTPLDLALLFNAELAADGIDGNLLLANHRDLVIAPLAAAHSPACFTVPVVHCGDSFYAFHQRDLAPGDTGLAGRQALRLADGKLLTVSDRRGGGHEEILTLALVGDNRLGGTWEARFSGAPAAARRAEWRFQSPPEWRQTSARLLHAIDPQAQAHNGTPVAVSGLVELDRPLEVSCKFTVPRGYEPLGDNRLVVPLPQLPLPDELRTLPTNRRGPLLLADPLKITLTTIIAIPPGMEVARQPLDESLIAPGISISRELRQETENRTITVTRQVTIERTLLPAPGHNDGGGGKHPDFAACRRVLTEILRPENRLLVLLAPAAH